MNSKTVQVVGIALDQIIMLLVASILEFIFWASSYRQRCTGKASLDLCTEYKLPRGFMCLLWQALAGLAVQALAGLAGQCKLAAQALAGLEAQALAGLAVHIVVQCMTP